MTIGRAAADHAGARPYLRRQPSASVLLSYCFSGCALRNRAFRSVLFLERFLDRGGPNSSKSRAQGLKDSRMQECCDANLGRRLGGSSWFLSS